MCVVLRAKQDPWATVAPYFVCLESLFRVLVPRILSPEEEAPPCPQHLRAEMYSCAISISTNRLPKFPRLVLETHRRWRGNWHRRLSSQGYRARPQTLYRRTFLARLTKPTGDKSQPTPQVL